MPSKPKPHEHYRFLAASARVGRLATSEDAIDAAVHALMTSNGTHQRAGDIAAKRRYWTLRSMHGGQIESLDHPVRS